MLTGVVFLLSVRVPAQSVEVNYDRSLTFSKYRSYAWGRLPNPDEIHDMTLAQEAQKQINRQLQDKGLQMIPESENPDLIVVASGGRKVDTYYHAWGTGSGWSGTGMPIVQPVKVETGTLVVELYDPTAKQLVWRGMAQGTLRGRSEKDIKLVEQAVFKLFKEYPAPK
jgi:hypothetical protein